VPADAQAKPDRTTTVVEDLRSTCCAQDVVDAVRALDGVRSAELHYQRGELQVDLDPALVDEEQVRRAVRERGYRCEGDPG
jgi:copper chaperone CopZ